MKKFLSNSQKGHDKKAINFNTLVLGEPEKEAKALIHSSTAHKSDKLPWLVALSSQMANTLPPQESPLPHSDNQHREREDSTDGPEPASKTVEFSRPTAPAPSPHLNPPVQLKKGMKFQAYKSTRPDLLGELSKMVDEGLTKIERVKSHNNKKDTQQQEEEDDIFHAERLKVYSDAFQHFIDESTIYQHFLQETKDTYDTYLFTLLDKLALFKQNASQVNMREQQLNKHIEKLKDEYQQQLNRMNSNIKVLEGRIVTLENDKLIAEQDCSKAKDQINQMRKEYDEMKGTCGTLTSGLSRMEDEHRHYQGLEAGRLTEITYLRASEQKLNEEIERLQQIVQNMEQIQGSMVSQDVVTNLETTVDGLRSELKRLDTTHKQLLIRYASIKSVVDDCFKKFERDQSGISNDYTKTRVNELVSNMRGNNKKSMGRKESTSGTDYVEKMLHVMESGGSPKLVVEVLLDHISSQHNRNKQNAGPYLDGNLGGDRDAFASEGGSTGRGNNGGTVVFEGEDGIMPAAEEFKSPWSHFDGMGYSESVPIYLRFHGKVQNLYLSKRETVRILREIWETRFAYDQHLAHQIHFEANALESSESTDNKSSLLPFSSSMISSSLIASLPINPSMAVFMEHFFMDKFNGNRVLAIEMAYNILDAVKRFTALSDCKMFTAVLDEKLPIEIWADQNNLLDRIRDEVQKEIKMLRSSSSVDMGEAGKLTSDQLIRLLRRILTTKTDHAINKLIKALALDNQSGRYINPEEVLTEDEHGNRPHFLEQLKLQHINEAISFEKHVIDCIDQFTDIGEKEMTVAKYRDALSYADSNKSRSEINKLLARGCGSTVEETLLMEAKRVSISVDDFKRRLRTGLLQKSPPSQAKKA